MILYSLTKEWVQDTKQDVKHPSAWINTQFKYEQNLLGIVDEYEPPHPQWKSTRKKISATLHLLKPESSI